MNFYDEIHRNVKFSRKELVRCFRRTWENYDLLRPFVNQVKTNMEQLGTKPGKPDTHYAPGSGIKHLYRFLLEVKANERRHVA